MSAALEKARELMDGVESSVEGWGARAVLEAAGVLAQMAVAEALEEIARQLERIQRLGVGGQK